MKLLVMQQFYRRKKTVVTTSSFVGKSEIVLTDAIEEICASKTHTCDVTAARISGGYVDYCLIMAKKHEAKKEALEGNVIILDSYDGAEH